MNNSQSLLQTVQSSLISERIILGGGGGYVCEVNLHPSMRLLISEAE